MDFPSNNQRRWHYAFAVLCFGSAGACAFTYGAGYYGFARVFGALALVLAMCAGSALMEREAGR